MAKYHVQVWQDGDFKKIGNDRAVEADDSDRALQQLIQHLQKEVHTVIAPHHAAVTKIEIGKHHDTELFVFPKDGNGRLRPGTKLGTIKFGPA